MRRVALFRKDTLPAAHGLIINRLNMPDNLNRILIMRSFRLPAWLPVFLTCLIAVGGAGASVSDGAPAAPLKAPIPQRNLQNGRTFGADPGGEAVAWFLGWNGQGAAMIRARGSAFYTEGTLVDAERWLGLAQVLDPDDLPGLKNMAFALKATGRYEEAHDALAACLERDPADFDFWWWYGDVQRLLGEYEESVESLRAAVDAAPDARREELNRYVDYSRSLAATDPSWENFEYHRDFAHRHDTVHRVRRLIAEYEAALAVAPETPPDDAEGLAKKAWVNAQLGMQHAFLKEHAVGAWYFGRAIELYTTSNNPEDIVRNLNSLGDCYAAIAERAPEDRALFIEEAVACRARAEEMARSFNTLDLWRHTLGRQLETLAQWHALDDPILVAVRERAAKEIPFSGPINDYSLCSILRGEIACRMKAGDHAGVRVLIEMTLPYLVKSQYLEDSEQAARYRAVLGQCLLAQDHPKQAEEAARQAYAGVDQIRSFTDGDAFLRSSAPRTLREAAGVIARAAIGREDSAAAFSAIEEYEGRRLAALLGAAPASETHRTDYPAELESTRGRAAKLARDLEQARQSGATPRVRILELCQAHDQARLEWLERRSAFAAGARLTAKPPAAIDAAALQAAMPADAACVLYLADSAGLAAVVVRNDGVVARFTEGATSESLLDATRRLRAALVKGEDTASFLAELEASILAPVLPELARERIYFVPDVSFAGLPLEALPMDGAVLGVTHTTACALSGAHVAASFARARAGGGVIECGATAPCRAADLREPASPVSLLRLRCPASVMEPNAVDSAFVLAGPGNQPEYLYWRDLLTCRWPAPLLLWLPPGGNVVTEAGASDALHALAYCAGAAGARGVLMPLWFNDSPEPRLSDGDDAAGELRDFRRNALAADPASLDWCRFILYVD